MSGESYPFRHVNELVGPNLEIHHRWAFNNEDLLYKKYYFGKFKQHYINNVPYWYNHWCYNSCTTCKCPFDFDVYMYLTMREELKKIEIAEYKQKIIKLKEERLNRIKELK